LVYMHSYSTSGREPSKSHSLVMALLLGLQNGVPHTTR
jgi:hypothetical protein